MPVPDVNRLHDISLELTHARRARITHTRKHHEEKHSTNRNGTWMPLPRGITLPSGSRPVYGLSRFDAPPSRASAQWLGVPDSLARPRSITVAGAAQELGIQD